MNTPPPLVPGQPAAMPTVVAVAVLASSVYGAGRFALNPNLGECVASAVLMTIFLLFIARKMSIRRLTDIRRALASPLRPWLSFAATLGVVAMGISRHGVPVPLALFHGLFAFVFFTASAALFMRRTPE